jgi:hypothetical protein
MAFPTGPADWVLTALPGPTFLPSTLPDAPGSTPFSRSIRHPAHRIAAIGIGMLTGAQWGAYLSARVKGAWLIRSLALALILVGLRMLIAVLW